MMDIKLVRFERESAEDIGDGQSLSVGKMDGSWRRSHELCVVHGKQRCESGCIAKCRYGQILKGIPGLYRSLVKSFFESGLHDFLLEDNRSLCDQRS